MARRILAKIRRFYRNRPGIMSIVLNKKAFHDYFIEEKYEAGLVLDGWEVKSIRAGRVQIREAYVIVKNGEIWLLGMHVTPLATASTHVNPDPIRTRKLLLHENEIMKLIGKVERAGFTLIPLNLHYSRGRIKAEIGLAKGKKQHDKRDDAKEKDWAREKQRLVREKVRAG
jgi:SsrA-binding protein